MKKSCLFILISIIVFLTPMTVVASSSEKYLSEKLTKIDTQIGYVTVTENIANNGSNLRVNGFNGYSTVKINSVPDFKSRFSIVNIILNLLLTIIICSFPIMIYRYSIVKRPVGEEKARKITIIYAVIALFVMVLLGEILNGNGMVGGAVFFWSWINYKLLTGGKSRNGEETVKISTEETQDIVTDDRTIANVLSADAVDNELNENPPAEENSPQPISQVSVSEFPMSEKSEDEKKLSMATKTPKRWIAFGMSCFVILLILAGLNIYQYESAQNNEAKNAELIETITKMESQIDSLNSAISAKNAQMSNKSTEIKILRERASSFKINADNYEVIVNTIKSGKLGYAANNFQSSESVIVVGENEKNRKFTLTANWVDGGMVSVDYDTHYPAAYVSFEENSWSISTNIIIQPNHSGVTVVTFSNDVNEQTFNVIIIVE